MRKRHAKDGPVVRTCSEAGNTMTIALHFGLLSTAVVLDVLRSRHPAVEVVITGRYAPQALIDAADLVTEMCDVKHYYTQGVLSRDGIDR